MRTKAPAGRPPVAARRVGYVIAAVLTAGFWYVLVLVRVWQVFPFAFTGSVDWARVVRVVLVVAVAGSIVGMTVNLVALIRRAAHSGGPGTVGRRAL